MQNQTDNIRKKEASGNRNPRSYLAIDLKSFYASVECVERGENPLETNLVVADQSRTDKTICLAVSPSLKAYGIPGRPRLFEVVQKVKEVNGARARAGEEPLDYIVATPRMALYMEYSTRIYHIYLRYIAPEDIHVYSIDEVIMDVTHYLKTYHMTARELAVTMIREVLAETGITATVGIGTNMYLCKIAMDIVAKHATADADGVRIGELDERSYRRTLWAHQPLTDFWRVGRGYAKKLAVYDILTMGDIARCSLGGEGDFYNEELLYQLFGVNAELLIDHAWGVEPCTMEEVKAYRPEYNSLGSGQVLQSPYPYEKARLIVQEMTDLLALDLVRKHLVTDQLVLTVGYDIENLINPEIRSRYRGPVKTDHYGRQVPKHAHGTENLEGLTSSTSQIVSHMLKLFERIVNPVLLVRRVTIAANHVVDEKKAQSEKVFEQLDLSAFLDMNPSETGEGTEGKKKLREPMNQKQLEERRQEEEARLEREKRMQQAMLTIKDKYGKNAILKGMNLEEGGMTIERNGQIGGHKA